jgi:hypothetical protein
VGIVTGTFALPNGTAVGNGAYQWKLSGDAIQYVIPRCDAPRLFSGSLDTNGNMTATFDFNDVLSTNTGLTTYYQLTIKDSGGGQVWNEFYYLTGTTANLNLIPPLGNPPGTVPLTVTAISGAGSLNGNGAFFFGPGLFDLHLVYGNQGTGVGLEGVASNNGTAYLIQVYLFNLVAPITIRKISQLSAGNSAGTYGYFGIYSYAGNLLVNGGQFLEVVATGIQTNTLVTPVTLPVGTYWHAQAFSTSSSCQFQGFAVQNGNVIGIFTTNSTRAATAATLASASGLPATLGALTPFVPNSTNGDVVFCPLYE